MRPLVFLFLLIAGCEQIITKQVDIARERAYASISLAKQLDGPVKPDKPSGKCENCNGTGKVGDGRVFVPCPVCQGQKEFGEKITEAWSGIKDATDRIESSINEQIVPRLNSLEERIDKVEKFGKPVTSKVIVHSMDGCEPCIRWWNNVRPVWEKQGWIVEKIVESEGGPFPWFHIIEPNLEFDVKVYLTHDSYEKAKKAALQK